MNAAEHDVVVIGAGPAGTAVAIALCRRGLRVAIAERATFPRDKVCGCTLDGHAVAALERLRATPLLQSLQPVPLTHVRVAARSSSTVLPLRGTRAVSRVRFDAALAAAASDAGALLESGHAVVHTTRTAAGFVVERSAAPSWTARAIVTAAGLTDAVLSPPASIATDARIGVAATLAQDARALAPGELRMHVGVHGYVGLARLEDESIRVAAVLDPAAVHSGSVAAAIGAILAESGDDRGIPPSTAFRSTPALSRTRLAVAEPGVFAVGDACGYVEPFSGEGIGWALRSAELAAPFVHAWTDGDPHAHLRYDAAWRRHIDADRGSARRLRAWSRHPRWLAAALNAVRIAPRLARIWMPA